MLSNRSPRAQDIGNIGVLSPQLERLAQNVLKFNKYHLGCQIGKGHVTKKFELTESLYLNSKKCILNCDTKCCIKACLFETSKFEFSLAKNYSSWQPSC